MANELVKVELIANPAVTRTMTLASYRNNTNKWRMAGIAQEAQPPQKKSAEPVEVKPVMEIVSISSQDSQDLGFVADPTQTATMGSENVTTTVEPTGLIDGLRAQYKAVAGKDADKRWGVKKLSEEIKNLNTPAQ